MGRGIKLSDNDVDQLDSLRFRTDSADVFRNCLIILMSDAGDTIAAIARRLGCTTFTVNRIRRVYRQAGIDALAPYQAAGTPQPCDPRIHRGYEESHCDQPADAQVRILELVSLIRLAAHLAKVTGVRFSDDQLRRLLHQEGYSVHLPKHTMKGKPQRGRLRGRPRGNCGG